MAPPQIPQQPGEHEAIRDFRNELRECTIKTPDPPVACGRSYVRVSKLVEWWRSSTTLRGKPTTQATRLLDYAYREWREHSHSNSMTKEKLFGGHPCIIVFSILLKIGAGDFVHLLRALGKFDKDLPMEDPETVKACFRHMALMRERPREISNCEQLTAAFYREQWQFCPVKFGFADYRYFNNNSWIIPIYKKEIITDKGGTAKLWQIEVLKEFVSDTLQKVVKTSQYTPEYDPDRLGARYHFALKTFNEGNGDICHNEIEAFNALRQHRGMVLYLGGYNHQEMHHSDSAAPTAPEAGPLPKTTYNILLQYGDQDLEELFFYQLPPVLQNEIEAFWKHLFDIADAVKRIHNLTIENDGMSSEYYGWHADIKPDNILEIEGEFKLADPGFARFLEKDKGKSNSDPRANMSGGTYSFGAPELHPGRRGSGEANQTIDVWSLGCVFSVAATWIALGYQGIKQYSELRAEAISERIKRQLSQPTLNVQGPKLDQGDYFHDGLNVLPEVRNWHQYLHSSLRKTDRITSKVLNLVDNEMLVGSPDLRIKSSALCDELTKISQSLKESRIQVPETILKFLKALDERISTDTANTASVEVATQKAPSHSTFKDRKDRKSNYLRAPLIQTAHRSYHKSMLAPPRSSEDFRRPPLLENIEETDSPVSMPPTELSASPTIHVPQQPTFVAEPEEDSTFIDKPLPPSQPPPLPPAQSLPSTFQPSPPPHSSQPPPHITTSPTGFSNSVGRRENYPIENVFQARVAIEKRRKKGVFSIFRSANRKDELLAKYYKNRDIKFLVDNAETMAEHWENAKHLLETLVMKVEGLDDDGVDLAFTQGTANAKNIKGISKIMEKMSLPEAMPMTGVPTDMIEPLQDIFDDYNLMAQKKSRHILKLKKMTIIVLTDGIWGNTVDKDGVGRSIVAFVKNLKTLMGRDLTDRPVSIEFVQFGNHYDATLRLKALDDDLKNAGIPDLVDTEHCMGDVNKMLLGSFVPLYDEMEDDDVSTIGGPSSRTPQRENSYAGSQRKMDNSRQSTYTHASLSQSSSQSPPGQADPFMAPASVPRGQAGGADGVVYENWAGRYRPYSGQPVPEPPRTQPPNSEPSHPLKYSHHHSKPQ